MYHRTTWSYANSKPLATLCRAVEHGLSLNLFDVLLDDPQISCVRLEDGIAHIADDGHKPDAEVDQAVAEHAQERERRHPQLPADIDLVQRNRRGDRVAQK